MGAGLRIAYVLDYGVPYDFAAIAAGTAGTDYDDPRGIAAELFEQAGVIADYTALSEAEVQQLADAYSEARDRLHPHSGVKLGS